MSTKDNIFKVSVELFSEKGFRGTSIREIARIVGIKESSIYNHFSSKESILQAILEYQVNGLAIAEKSFENLKPEINRIDDPVEFWISGAIEFIKYLPDLSDSISKIIINEMYLNEQCRKFYLSTLQVSRLQLTVSIFESMQSMGMIKDIDIKKTATQYIYMIQGLEIEQNLRALEGENPIILQQQLLDQITYFIEGLRVGEK